MDVLLTIWRFSCCDHLWLSSINFRLINVSRLGSINVSRLGCRSIGYYDRSRLSNRDGEVS